MQRPLRQSVALSLALALAGFGVCSAPVPAYAEPQSVTELTALVEDYTTQYHEAQANLDQLNAQIQENEGRIAELEAQLPEQRAKTAASIKNLYLFHQSSNGLLDLVLSAEDFSQFVSLVRYLDDIQAHNIDSVNNLLQLQDELNVARGSLDMQKQQAQDEVDRALQALSDAEDARDDLRAAAAAQAAAEEAERAQAMASSTAHAGETFTTASGREVVVEAPATTDTTNGVNTTPTTPTEPEQQAEQQVEAEPEPEPEPEPAPVTNSRDEFISVWAARIDAYNAGTPLGGYGSVFAEAAYDCGVDPRWSPAIALVESSSGEYCFADHNAWGWGSVDWPDWPTAIWGHVSGLASGYGYTNSYSAACTYCPPNADFWYARVSEEMYAIWPTDSL